MGFPCVVWKECFHCRKQASCHWLLSIKASACITWESCDNTHNTHCVINKALVRLAVLVGARWLSIPTGPGRWEGTCTSATWAKCKGAWDGLQQLYIRPPDSSIQVYTQNANTGLDLYAPKLYGPTDQHTRVCARTHERGNMPFTSSWWSRHQRSKWHTCFDDVTWQKKHEATHGIFRYANISFRFLLMVFLFIQECVLSVVMAVSLLLHRMDGLCVYARTLDKNSADIATNVAKQMNEER